MVPSKIKNLDLAAQIDEGQLAWLRYVTPITEHYVRQIAQRDYRGKDWPTGGTSHCVATLNLPEAWSLREVIQK